MTEPKRIQLSRKRGWRKPEGAIVVSRPSPWGNPYKVGPYLTPEHAVWLYRHDLAHNVLGVDVYRRIRDQLGGHDLCCWCPLDQLCHADVLLELANR